MPSLEVLQQELKQAYRARRETVIRPEAEYNAAQARVRDLQRQVHAAFERACAKASRA